MDQYRVGSRQLNLSAWKMPYSNIALEHVSYLKFCWFHVVRSVMVHTFNISQGFHTFWIKICLSFIEIISQNSLMWIMFRWDIYWVINNDFYTTRLSFLSINVSHNTIFYFKLCRGVGYLHENKPSPIIHRDLEPS
jgi:serine/threonine protein kinase